MERIFFLIVMIGLFSSVPVAYGQSKSYRDEALLLKKTILQNHVSPRKIDDQFSRWVFKHFLDELDPDRLYFTEEDLQTLRPYSSRLDDELNGTSWSFLPAVTQLYKKNLQRAEIIAAEIFQSPVSLSVKESYSRDTLWAKNENELKNRWRLGLKYQILSRLHEIVRSPEQNGSTSIHKHEAEARLRVQAVTTRSIKRISNHASGYENYIASVYLQTIALSFDPHSAYFSPAAMENFLSSVSSEGYYFGLMLNENEKGEVVIEQLTPGGPAWKSGVLNSGDVIREVKWEGKEALDLSGAGLEEINDVLLETNHSSLEITVAKPGGVPETLVLRKEKMEAEENIVKSFVLDGNKKIGYISLPGFYTNMGETEGSRCANDVAKEVIKLKKENVEGLILDLRFNGGGSLYEAVSMAGIFVDAGPIGVVKDKTGEAITMKDTNRGTVYDGPLVLLVNGMSASASEFLAASLQDYQRAIIVGSPTYGKASAQVLFPLDPKTPNALPGENLRPGIAYASVTIEKIYRITGKTAQQRGVKPHIILPDIYDSLDFRENVMPLALSYDSIFKKTYYQPLTLLPVAELKHKSELRLSKDEGFKTIRMVSRVLAQAENRTTPVSLSWADFKAHADNTFNAVSQIRKEDQVAPFTVGHHQFEMQRMQMDQYIEDFNKAWVKKLQHDISLAEAFHIICDYIDITLRNKK